MIDLEILTLEGKKLSIVRGERKGDWTGAGLVGWAALLFICVSE